MSATDRLRAYIDAVSPYYGDSDSVDRGRMASGEVLDLTLADLREVLSLADAYESVSR